MCRGKLLLLGCVYRYDRLCKLELQAIDDEMTEGQKNVFHAMQREGEEEEEFDEDASMAQTLNTNS